MDNDANVHYEKGEEKPSIPNDRDMNESAENYDRGKYIDMII